MFERNGPSTSRNGGASAVRGQSSPLGVILILAIVIAGSTLVVAIGSQAVSDTRDELGLDRAENTMTQLDSQAAMVALGNSDVQQVALQTGTAEGYAVENESGWMNVSYRNVSTGDVTTIYNKSMGAIVYRSGSQNVTYQGGGVWRERDNHSVLVSPPEFHFRNATLTLPMVQVRGDQRLGGRAAITKNSSTRYFPNQSINDDFRNPLENGKVNITVQSRYYRAWGSYFQQRTDGEVHYDHDRHRATLTLVSPVEKRRITSAAASLSASGTFELHGSAHVSCGATVYTNSYNSSGTPDGYCLQTGSTGNEGDIVYGDNVDISSGSGTSNIRGDLVSGGNVKVASGGGAGQPDVHGHINYTNQCNPSVSDCEDRILVGSGGEVNQIGGVESVSSINSVVQEKVSSARSGNDNGDTNNVSSNSLVYGTNDLPANTAELGAGTYYLTELTPSSDRTIRLNTTEGDVTVVVKENVDLAGSGSGGATIEVTGDGVANLYVGGTGGHSTHFAMAKNAAVTNSGDDAPQFRLYGQDNLTVQIGSGNVGNPAFFTGVVYAPPGDGGSARVDVDGGVVYGGVLTGTTTIDGGAIHYDEALRNRQVMSRDDTIVKLTYLHVSVNRINVTSA